MQSPSNDEAIIYGILIGLAFMLYIALIPLDVR